MKRDPKITHTRGDCIVVNNRQEALKEYNAMSLGDKVELLYLAEQETGKWGVRTALDYLLRKDAKNDTRGKR